MAGSKKYKIAAEKQSMSGQAESEAMAIKKKGEGMRQGKLAALNNSFIVNIYLLINFIEVQFTHKNEHFESTL